MQELICFNIQSENDQHENTLHPYDSSRYAVTLRFRTPQVR